MVNWVLTTRSEGNVDAANEVRLAPLSGIGCETYHLTLTVRRCICHPGITGMVVAWHMRNFLSWL